MSFWEPWRASKSTTHGSCPEPIPDEPDISRTLAENWHRLDKQADYVVWATDVVLPCIVRTLLTQEAQVVGGDRIMLVVGHKAYIPDGQPNQKEIAERVAACVTACAGIKDPEKFISDARALVLDLARGEYDPTNDHRAASLLSRCIPPEENEEDI